MPTSAAPAAPTAHTAVIDTSLARDLLLKVLAAEGYPAAAPR
jgi:hypothetical protein